MMIELLIGAGLYHGDRLGLTKLETGATTAYGTSRKNSPRAPDDQAPAPQAVSTWSGQAREQAVQRMFTAIAGVYDLNNTLLSFGLHTAGKTHGIVSSRKSRTGRALDIGAGTADLALLIEPKMGDQGRVVASDLNHAMLAEGFEKGRGDAGCRATNHLPAGQRGAAGLSR